ncbi:hypothetical protein QNH39_01065 [Neobacillus novalis]|uniref:Uncharacterized protein n=1 Tax=Neobacillus novalis TaxID=220687 RepID=A0AA95SCV2_9BACI|nr:hypothetical protein [Neobacillus novalis]WHY86518.1 hypothetical protein QNH39_01065 [Neobacillus novalis]
MIYVSLVKGSVPAIMAGLIVPLILIMADITQTAFNFILFDYEFFFVDSLLFITLLNCLISILGKILIKKYNLYF